jgi:Family of unknown function (DUF5343)
VATAVTYPKISRKIWWLLRERFKKTIPTAVTSTFVTSITPMTDGSAKSNVIAPLRELGLLDEASKPTAIASRWRHDDEYAAVCHEIRSKVYPSDLVEAFPDASLAQKEQIKTWFMKVGHVGEAAARMYTDTYLLLTQANPNQAAEKPSRPAEAKPIKQKVIARPANTPSKVKETNVKPIDVAVQPPALNNNPNVMKRGPSIHIDVQVHISPDTTPEQIDRIFESMGKHLGTYIN